jgi:alpha-tubulin suppressor-like RCC1 family protein
MPCSTGCVAPPALHATTQNVLGWDHTCALVTGGGVKCWGRNDTGQLGDNTTMGRTLPTDVSGLTAGVVALTIGYQQTYALTTAGEVKCWGDNMHSQLGDGTTMMRKVPTPLSTR